MSDRTVGCRPPGRCPSGRGPDGWELARSATAIVLVIASPLLIVVAGAAGEERLPPAGLTVVLAATAGVGVAMLTGGTLSVRIAVRHARRRHPAIRAAVAVAALGVVVAAPTVARHAGGSGTAVVRVAPLGAIVLIAAHHWWSRRGPDLTAEGRRPWVVTSALVAGYLAASAVTVVLALPDVYPFSRYPMYSAPRTDPYVIEEVAFVATYDDGNRRQLPRPGSRQVLLSLVSDEDLDRLEQLARDLATHHDGVVEMVVEHRSVAVARHPDPPDVEVVEAEIVTTVDLG